MEGVQEARRLGHGRHSLDCLLHLPPGYPRSAVGERWPLVLFLHGAGERGSDVRKVAAHGIPRAVEEDPNLPFVAVSPQCPPHAYWTEVTPFVWQVLEDAVARLAVDPDRVYLTGMSMGGFGAFKMASEEPDRFAALVPVCGGGDPAWAPQLSNLPTWVFHGSADPVVPVEASLRMVEALERVGAPVRSTIYPGVGHDSWTRTYRDPELYRWLLEQSRA